MKKNQLMAEAKPSTKIKSTSKKDVVAKKKTIIKKNKD